MREKISGLVNEKLRACQLKSIDTIDNYLTSDTKRSCLISLPTGAGKSGVICIVGHFSSFSKILVVTHRRAVCDQLYKQLKGKFFEKILGKDSDYKKFISKKIFNQINDTSKPGVYCTTFQKITSLAEEELLELKDTFELILIDEGHAEPSPKWGTAIRVLKAKKVIITATPYRNDLFSFDIDAEHSYIYSYKEAIADGVIVSPSFETVDTNKIFEIIDNLKESQPESVCLIKCKEFSDIENYFSIFKNNYKTVAIHEQYKDKNIENTFQDVPINLAELDYEVMIHQKKLDEGIDIPKAKILILTYPVGSGKELVQTIGRVVRVYEEYQPKVLELSGNSNHDLWHNYLEFDEYISNPSSAERFLRTLDTSLLIENYLDVFPDRSYFDAGYRKKFNFQDFDPTISLEIPLASVCFYYKIKNFSLNDCIDKLYWEFSREGALSKYDLELGVITSVCFNNSRFLKDSLFFEPSLEIMILKEIGNIIAIFDSRSRKFSNRDDLKIGRSIDVDTLFSVISEKEITKTKQANTKAIQLSRYRPEGISFKGSNLEAINHSQSNSSYAVTTAIVSNIDDNDKTTSSYYLGVGSGRICDQKSHKPFTYNEFIGWVNNINDLFQSGNRTKSAFLSSFSQSIEFIPTENPIACIIDFFDFSGSLAIEFNGYKKHIPNEFIFKKYNNGIKFFDLYYPLEDSRVNDSKNLICFRFNKKNELIAECDSDLKFFLNDEKIDVCKIFNDETVELLYKDGTTFLNGFFYKYTLPTERSQLNQNIIKNLISLDCLLDKNLSEKDEDGLTTESFGENSIFHLIDKMSNIKNNNIELKELGDFFKYVPDVDLILCTDMGTEPADFIISSKDKVIYAHIKCGSTSLRPESSAGSISLVGSQALKNLHYLTSSSPSNFANIETIRSSWPRPTGNKNNICLNSRIRLFDKKFDPATPLSDVIRTIDQRRMDPLVSKEIWIIMGNSFSHQHFTLKMKNPSTASPETIQAYQLLDTWFSQASLQNVDIKVFVSP